MSLDLDDDILQDFLVEAGEILEQLNEQLVDLEQHPQDQDLLNAVFRGFHTVKGGAGFLGLNALVEICHKAEDAFNLLRNGSLAIDAPLMDVVLRAYDAITNMFAEVRAGGQPQPADPHLLAELASYLHPADAAQASALSPTESVGEERAGAAGAGTAGGDGAAPAPGGDDITEAEFEALLDAVHGDRHASGSGKAVANAATSASVSGDDISEDEFEQLLDELHGQGKAPGAPTAPGSDDISEDEFEQLLDELHGQGKAPGAPTAPGSDDISEDEFEQLLDKLHGAGKGPSRGAPGAGSRTAGDTPRAAVKAQAPSAPSAHGPAKAPGSAPAPGASRGAAEAVTVPGAAAQNSKTETTVRVDTRRLDDIMNLVGELVLARNRLTSLRGSFEDDKVAQAVSALDVVTADLQGAVMKTRMQPIKKVFGRFPRVVRDLARSLDKEVELTLLGEETDLDKNLVEALADPLVHLVRNAVDHGIEAPDVREAAGKARQGSVLLSAEQAGDHILLTIQDDGAGMDPNKLREMAVRKGMLEEEAAARLSEKECYELIFLPGTSTKTEISDVSGRGVGMDVVKTRIAQLNGMIDIDSELGRGTTLSIKVPLTLAILPTLMVVLGTRKFALPLSVVNEIFELAQSKTNVVDGQTVVQVRGKAPPLFFLREWLLQPDERERPGANPQVIMVQIGNRVFGLVVDQVIGQEEVVIKPLGALLHGLPGLSGATITGDGHIALILDVPGLLRAYATRN